MNYNKMNEFEARKAAKKEVEELLTDYLKETYGDYNVSETDSGITVAVGNRVDDMGVLREVCVSIKCCSQSITDKTSASGRVYYAYDRIAEEEKHRVEKVKNDIRAKVMEKFAKEFRSIYFK